MPTKKILQLSKYYPPYKGGIELVAKMISKAHCEDHSDVHIFSYGHESKEYVGEFGENVFQFRSLITMKSTPGSLFYCYRLKKEVKKNYERIYVHLHNPFTHLALWLAMLFGPVSGKIIGVYHSDVINQKRLAPLFHWFFLKTSSIYDSFIVSSENLWNSSPVLQKIDSRKKRVIPFCTEGGNQLTKRERFSGKLLAIGRLVPYKGFDFLVETLKSSHYDLTIIGSGPLYDQLNAIKGPRIKILPSVSDQEKHHLIAQSDALIVPSINRAEAYGMIIVEAFENGLPVICSDIETGMTFLVKDQQTGLTFRRLDSAGLLTCLKKFETDSGLYKKISHQCHQFYLEQLVFSVFKEKILAIC